ncbi:MAG: hypothetical protein ACR2P2_13825 [Nakamurella sp.]
MPDDAIVVELSLAEAMTVAAAVRQYEPYWSPSLGQSAVVQELTDTRAQITSVLAKLRAAAGLER